MKWRPRADQRRKSCGEQTDERAATLEPMDRAENKTVTDTVRAAIDEHIEARRKDKAFMERLKARHERELFERLAK
jgi:hypothetical protein